MNNRLGFSRNCSLLLFLILGGQGLFSLAQEYSEQLSEFEYEEMDDWQENIWDQDPVPPLETWQGPTQHRKTSIVQLQATGCRTYTDWSGDVEIINCVGWTPTARQRHRVRVTLPAGYVAVGGSFEFSGANKEHYVTESRPDTDKRSWIVASKDHGYANPHRVTVSVIGLRLNGVSFESLKNLLVLEPESTFGQKPQVDATLPDRLPNYRVVGGGFQANYQDGHGTDGGMLLEVSYPLNDRSWRARAVDHAYVDYGTLTAWVIGLPTYIPSFGDLELSREGDTLNWPINGEHTANEYVTKDWVVTCPGGRASPLHFINKMNVAHRNDSTDHWVQVRSKDLIWGAHGWLAVWAVKVRRLP